MGQFGDGDGKGETPAQIFWHISVKKSGTICPNWGGGGGGGGGRSNLNKIQKNSCFFGKPYLLLSISMTNKVI